MININTTSKHSDSDRSLPCSAEGDSYSAIELLQRLASFLDEVQFSEPALDQTPRMMTSGQILQAFFRTEVSAVLLPKISKYYSDILANFLDETLMKLKRTDTSVHILSDEELESLVTSWEDRNQKLVKELSEKIGLVQPVKQICLEKGLAKIPGAILAQVAGEYDQSYLESMIYASQTFAQKWLEFYDADTRLSVMKEVEQKVKSSFFKMRCEELFDIIVDFPDSEPALNDIASCLRTNNRWKFDLQIIFKKALSKRLLQPGAPTTVIIEQYISTIKSILVLDSSGDILTAVAEPIRSYLRTRDDTVKCIIEAIFDESNPDLAAELKRTELINFDDEDYDDVVDSNFLDWNPPVSNNWGAKKILRSPSDILNSLVSIFDTTDVFVQAFQEHLSRHLLAATNYDTDKEISYVELLKLRFGEAALQPCEVMVKDVADSKRIDNFFYADGKHSDNKVHAIILSHLFWPQMKSASFRVPDSMEKLMVEYATGFEGVKRSRKLNWLLDLGTVELSLQLDDGETRDFVVTPIQAAIISAFEEKDVWTSHELSSKIEIKDDLIQANIGIWLQHKVLLEINNGEYRLRQGSDEDQEECLIVDYITETTAEDVCVEEMAAYWTFVSAMLTNLGSLPLARIHSMLTMFVQAPNKFDKSMNDLQLYLDSLVRQDQLEFANGQYSLKK